MANAVYGTELNANDQAYVLNAYIHRYTAEHKPDWANTLKPDGTPYKPQFASDADWLANTKFYVRKDDRLSNAFSYCESHPTWPFGQ